VGCGARGCHVAVAHEQKIATGIRRGNGELARRIGVEVGRHFLSIIEPGFLEQPHVGVGQPLAAVQDLNREGLRCSDRCRVAKRIEF
jgi:hypothetical protein